MYSSYGNVNINWMLAGKKNFCLGSCSCPNGAERSTLASGRKWRSYFFFFCFARGASNHNYTI